ncbi:MAG: chaperonin GroEL [Rickettsiales bacterium]
MAVKIEFSSDARAKILKGAKTIADAVKVTLGPKGRNVLIEKALGSPLITKDGVTVAKEIELEDKLENMGAQIIKQATQQSANHSGDGTTTCTVLAYEMLFKGYKQISSGASPIAVSDGINYACEFICKNIKDNSRQIAKNEDILNVATISANNDSKIGEMISKAVEKVGKDGVITVEESKSNETSVVVTQGMELDRGYISPYFVTNNEKMIAEYQDPYVLIAEQKISTIQSILPILEKVAQSGRSLLIITEDIDGDALPTLILNKLRGGLKVAAIKAPGFGDRRKDILQDIAIITGATVITSDLNLKLENTELEHLGTIARVEIHKDKTILVSNAISHDNLNEHHIQNKNSNIDYIKAKILARCNSIKAEITNTTSDYDKEKLQERLAKLAGGIAVIKVGGATEIEMKERKDRIDDAVSATKAAIELGIVPGGGLSLLHQINRLNIHANSLDNKSEDFKIGMRIVADSLSAPLRTIVENAGHDFYSVNHEILHNNKGNVNYGYDALNNNYCDLVKTGIIDPVKVVIDSIKNAGSAAAALLTAECAITKIEKEGRDERGVMPGMGGMGGMY